ncbi:MAG: 50S ribosomal protein L1 [Candidatus Thorarchaeota archaeon]|nr:50S ribosomal protein L1 [Candidatus Thorarchaeota archaeon]
MSVDMDRIVSAVGEARAQGKARGIKFEQSFDFSVSFRKKEMDISKPENRFNQELTLPNRLYPPAKVCAFGDGDFAAAARTAGVERVVSKEEIPRIGEEKRERKSLARNYDYFIASTDTMPLIGRYLGQALGSRGKMPKPFPPQADLTGAVSQYQRTVRIRMRSTPTFHVKVGHERMTDKEIAENIMAVLNLVDSKGHTPKIGDMIVKTTMGPPVRITSWR